MKSSQIEVNKLPLPKDKIFKKDLSINFTQNLSKKYSTKPDKRIKTEKNKLQKSTTKTTLKKSKEVNQNKIKSFLTNNSIHEKNNKQKNKNISKNSKVIIIDKKTKKNDSKIHSKNISSTNICLSPNPQHPCLDNVIKNKNKHVSRNNLIKIKSPQLTDFIKNNNKNKKIKHRNNNNVLKSNLGLLITNNQNYEGTETIFKDNESYFEINNILNSNDKQIIFNNKSDLNENEISSEDYLTKVNKKNNERSSLLNSIININRYLTNNANSKSKIRINNDKNTRIKSRKTYENQLAKTPDSEDISKTDKNFINASKSDFLQDINFNNNKKDLIDKSINNEYIYSDRTSSNNKKIIKNRHSFNFDEDTKINSKYIENILGFSTPKVTINNEFIKSYRFSPNIININKTLVNTDSDYKNYSKKIIKVSKAKLYKNDKDHLSLKKQINTIQKEQKDISTQSNSNKNNNLITERKNLMKINEFQITNELVLTNETKKDMNEDCNNIFDEVYYNNDTKLNKYNNLSERDNFPKNNKNIKKKKNNNSCCSCIYSPVNINNQYNTLSTQRGDKYNYSNIDSDFEQNDEKYLKTLEEDNNSNIQEIKIKLNIPKKKNKPKAYVYYHSPSYRKYKPPEYQNNKNDMINYLSDNCSFERIKVNNQNVYTKQIFSNYNFNSKSKEKNKLNKNKIDSDNINKRIDLENIQINKKCIYKNSNNTNNNFNNVFQQNNFYTTNNFFTCSSKRIDKNKNRVFSPGIYVKPSGKMNNPINEYLYYSPRNQNYSPKNVVIKTPIINNKNNLIKAKTYIKKSVDNKNEKTINNIKTKVINKNKRCIKYYNYIIKIKTVFKPICYISKNVVIPKYRPKSKKSFITKSVFSIIHMPKPSICYISKIKINNQNGELFLNNQNDKDKNIIKANILDFSVEQNKEMSNENNSNHNRIIKYISNEKNYHESFGEINLSFSTEEINSFKQKESTIEGIFTDLMNMNSIIMNTESEVKITFCPNKRNNNYNIYNNNEAITFGRMINNSSNFAETERTERNERTTYKRDETIKEMKENINLKLPFKFNNSYKKENLISNTERVHLNRNNNSKIKGMLNSQDVINFTETLGNILDKKKTYSNSIQLNNDKIFCKCMTYFPKKDKKNKLFEKTGNNNIKLFNNRNKQNNENSSNFTFENIKNESFNHPKDEIRYLSNILTINNYKDIYEKFLKLMKDDNQNVNYFSEIIIYRFNNDKKYKILYFILCKQIIKEIGNNKINEEALSNIISIIKKNEELISINKYEKYIFNEYNNIISNKNNNIDIKEYNCFHSLDYINKGIITKIINDLINKKNNIDISINDFGRNNIVEVIQSYIEFCIDNTYNNKISISNCNDCIYKVISNILSKNDIKYENKEIIELILNINDIVVDNVAMLEIMGYLLYCLIFFELYTIDNFDSFLSKENFTIINLAKILKYTFSYANHNDKKNILDKFKENKLYKNNMHIFEKYALDNFN